MESRNGITCRQAIYGSWSDRDEFLNDMRDVITFPVGIYVVCDRLYTSAYSDFFNIEQLIDDIHRRC